MASENYPTVITYVGADGRKLEFTAKDAAGDAYDLTDLTLTITAEYGGNKKIDGESCNVTTAASGLFDYTPAAGEVDEVGQYTAQVKIVNGASKVDFLEKFYIDVRDPITPTA